MKKHCSNIILGLNLLAALIITVPALIVLISDKGFSPLFKIALGKGMILELSMN